VRCAWFLLDHLIRPVQNGLRNRQANLLRGFQIDHQLELRRLLHRQVRGFVPLRISQKRKNLPLGALNIFWKLDCGDVLPRQIWDIGNRFWAKISGFELARLSSLDASQALLKTLHLLFHDPHLDIQGLMKLHEPIDMGCKSINTIFHYRESLVYFFSEITNIKLD